LKIAATNDSASDRLIPCSIRLKMRNARASARVAGTTRLVARARSSARYAVELREGLSGTIKDVLDAATWDSEHERWGVGMPTTFIRDRILEVAYRQPVPDPTRPAGSLWRFPDGTYQAVREGFGLEVRKKP
jgi:hypothetical protein